MQRLEGDLPFYAAERLVALLDELRQRHVVGLVDHDLYAAEGLAPQGEGVEVPRGGDADGKEGDEGIDLVAEGHEGAEGGLGQASVRAGRVVVLLDRPGDLAVLALILGVDPAHRPLKLGELAHHVGEEVGLDQHRRPLDLCPVGHAEGGREPAGKARLPSPSCPSGSPAACGT